MSGRDIHHEVPGRRIAPGNLSGPGSRARRTLGGRRAAVLAGAAIVLVLLGSPSMLAASPPATSPAITVSPTVSVGSQPVGMAYDPGAHTLYTVNQEAASVSVVDTAHCNARSQTNCGQRVGTIALPSGSSPQSIDIDTTTNTLYVADTFKNLISVLNAATCNAADLSGCSQTPTLVPDPSGPLYVAVNSATDTVYITNPQLSGNDTVSVLDGATCNGQVTSGCGQALKTVRVGLSPVAIAIDQASDSVYVANVGTIENGDTVSVIDGATCNATQSSGCGQVETITVGEGPNWIVLDSGTHTAYTANLTDDSVSVINTATCNATVTSGCDQKTSTVHVGANPWALSIDQKLHSVYVANNWDDTVSVLNAATCNATVMSGCHAAPPTVQVGGAPQALLADPTTGTLYSANEGDSTVSVVNVASCGATTTNGCRSVPLTADVSKPFLNPPTKLTGGVAADGSTKTVYVANLGAGTVSVVNSATCNAAQRSGCTKPAATIDVGGEPGGVAVDQATDTVYVANVQGSTVSVIDGATCNATKQTGCSQPPATVTAGNGPYALAVDEPTDTVYVTNPGAGTGGDTVSVINGATCNAVEQSGCNQSPATITVGVGPLGIAVNPTTNTVYVSEAGKGVVTNATTFGDTVSVINGASCDGTDTSGCGQSPAQVTVGPAPWGIAVDPATNSIFVANNDGGEGPASLSVISGATCDGADTTGCSAVPSSIPGVGRAPNGIAFDASADAVYTANYQNASVSTVSVRVPDASHGAPPREAVGSLPGNVAVDLTNHTAYVTNSVNGTLSILTTAQSRAK
jgi:DNA-binding beta-propeller fold protein YncE